MIEFEVRKARAGFSMKLWRGERMCLIGFDVEAPEEDFVGFAIECKEPGSTKFVSLLNRLAFSYDRAAFERVTGDRLFPSIEAPFQKFRWIHFPPGVKDGIYAYRGTKMHMPRDGVLKKGRSLTISISLDPVTYHGFLDIGFTRNFSSSQAFRNKLGNPRNIDEAGKAIIPSRAEDALGFQKVPGDIYEWMGFEAYNLLFNFLGEARHDPEITLDVLAYDFNEPDILSHLEALGPRLRVVIDDSVGKNNRGHGAPDSPESEAVKRLETSAGAGNVTRTHFQGLQHHKVFIARRKGRPFKVLAGSTNFSFRGLYIQANNALVFDDADVAQLYAQVFEAAFRNPAGFKATELAAKWHVILKPGTPPVHFCFSPHSTPELSLKPLQGAIHQASSSVLYAVAFLYQMGKGLTKDEFDALMTRPVFTYGISDKRGQLALVSLTAPRAWWTLRTSRSTLRNPSNGSGAAAAESIFTTNSS